MKGGIFFYEISKIRVNKYRKGYDVNRELFKEEKNADVENTVPEENLISIYANRYHVMEPIEEVKEQRRSKNDYSIFDFFLDERI